MKTNRRSLFGPLLFLATLLSGGVIFAAEGFANFETAPIHPIALSPDGRLFAVCNLPDNRVEFFDLNSGEPVPSGSVPVGLDPVSVRFRSAEEIWVVNHISDSITILNPKTRRVLRTLETLDSPADVVFAGSPQRAFVSCAFPNTVQVFDPVTFGLVQNIAIAGDRPKSMDVAADGRTIYVAIFESGNGSTIVSPKNKDIGSLTAFSGLNDVAGPYGGANPPPNSSNAFDPPLGSNLQAPPRVNHIVKKNSEGKWLDDNQGDWTEYISGSKSALTDRIPGWDLGDHDVAAIDAGSLSVSYARRLMNLCMSVAVNPVTGQVLVVGTDGTNERRFEPVLQSIFTRIHLAVIEPGLISKRILDLNGHLDYAKRTLPMTERLKAVSDPRGIAVSSDGTRIYVTGMGTDNLVVLDQSGARVGAPIALPEGPTGIALDEARRRLYILCRFQSAVAVVSTENNAVVATIPIFDPTPQSVRLGRRHFYDSHHNSGLGQASCASCHPDGRMDRLAWDLGNPMADFKDLGTNRNFISRPAAFALPSVTTNFHPMKGPMVTQTLQDIIGSEPFHWRGDRDGIEEFNATFPDLLGRDDELTATEMREFKEFLASIRMPPNPFRTLSNTLRTNLVLTGHLSPPRHGQGGGGPLPPGNAVRGAGLFKNIGDQCSACHSLPTGLGPDAKFDLANNRWEPVAAGPNEARHISSAAVQRNNGLPFKVVQLRNLHEKVGFDRTSTNGTAGFGFLHDGGADSLARFILRYESDFDDVPETKIADTVAFLLSFAGADFDQPRVDSLDSPLRTMLNPPLLYGKDVPSGVGRQTTITSSNSTPVLETMVVLAQAATNRVDLVCKGWTESALRGWVYDRDHSRFQSDRAVETISFEQLRALAATDRPLTFTLVFAGTGQRIGVDRDSDGHLDQDEVDAGSNPSNALSAPGTVGLRIEKISHTNNEVELQWAAGVGKSYRVVFADFLPEDNWQVLPGEIQVSNGRASKTDSVPAQGPARYYRIEVLP